MEWVFLWERNSLEVMCSFYNGEISVNVNEKVVKRYEWEIVKFERLIVEEKCKIVEGWEKSLDKVDKLMLKVDGKENKIV